MSLGVEARDDASLASSEQPRWTACPRARELLRERLEAVIPGIEHLDVEDAATGLASACPGPGEGAHLRLTVVSASFEGVRPLQRQRLVHAALGSELASGAVHALPDLRALTPVQWRESVGAARTRWVEERLRAAIPELQHLRILDVTNGHAAVGFADGSKRALDPRGLELELTVVSPVFRGMRLLERQRLVSDALGPELVSGAVHALPRMKAWTPEKWAERAAEGPLHGSGRKSATGSRL